MTPDQSVAISVIPPKHLILRHALLSLGFVAIYLVLSRPEIIFVTRLGFVAWYPATGLVLGWMLGISPWYSDRDRCLAAGMDDYVSKPINAKDLFAAIDRVMPATSSVGA